MTILIDIGNTAIKWQLRELDQTTDTGRGDVSQLMLWLESLGNLPSQQVAVSCVRDDDFADELHDALAQLGCASVVFAESSAAHAGVSNAYPNPSSLGVDRWLAVLALKSRGHENGIVIDVGRKTDLSVLIVGQHMLRVGSVPVSCMSAVARQEQHRACCVNVHAAL